MKLLFLFILCHVSLMFLGQSTIGHPWTIECGASTNNLFKRSGSFNFRYISPRFKWSHEELSEEDEKHPEKFKKARLMLEVIYTPKLQVLCAGFNIQYRFYKYKRLALDAYGGLKFFFVPGPEFSKIPLLQRTKEIWYINIGLICQLDLGIILPFFDIGGDTILTIGTELNLHKLYKKPKRRYKLHPRKAEQ